MTNIANLPYDVLSLIGDKATESLEDKISKFTTMEEISQINRLIYKQEQQIKERINIDIARGCVYEMTFRRGKEDYQGLYLVNYKVINAKQDNIVVSKVEPDPNNSRIFGNYRIVEPSKRIYPNTLKTYKLVYSPPVVDWKKQEQKLIGVKNPYLLFKWDNPALANYKMINLYLFIIYFFL